MVNSSNIREKHSKEYYDSESVVYCKNCLSLKIMILDESTDYCDECGNTDLETTDIISWERMYEKKYGHKFLEEC